VDADQLVNRPSLPLALLSVSSLLPDRFNVTVVDQRLPGDWRGAIGQALARGPLAVGVSCLLGHQIHFALQVSGFVKERAPEVPVVWGGLHSPELARQALGHEWVDGVVSGEGEQTFLELAQALEQGEEPHGIPGLWWGDGTKAPPPREPLDMATLPDLPYHLVRVSDYVRFRKPGSSIMLETSRGCPHLCGFCSCQTYAHRWRGLPAARTAERIQWLHRHLGAGTVVVVDDNFFGNHARALEIFETLTRAGSAARLDLQGVRADALERMTDEDLALMKRAGVAKINVGVESGSPRVLELIKKGITVEQVLTQNRRLAAHGIRVQYNFITGFPTETDDELRQTVALALRLLEENRLAMLNYFCVFSPMPGTPLHDLVVRQGAPVPDTIEGWADLDRIYVNRWGHHAGAAKIQVPLNFVSLFVDRKVEYYTDSRLLGLLVSLYRPLARHRFARLDFRLLLEKHLFDALNRLTFGRG